MEDHIAIRITGLSKKYNLSQKKVGLSIGERIKDIFTRKHPGKSEDFYALKNISLTINKGESVGIIGRNGAGKSTLLKILAEVVEPSEGKVEINGTVASVLEIGMGFHPELTGRENVYLSGAMIGISKKVIDENLRDIHDFSGIGNFIDTPVKYYSSGMYLRLAFSVVANLNADILLFDETLSTGDIAFQQKCYERIDDLIRKGKTVLLVSHNLNDIIRISTRVLYLEKGLLKSDSQSESLNIYLKDAMVSNTLFDKNISSQVVHYADKKTVEFDAADYSAISEDIRIKKIQICAVNKDPDAEMLTSDEIELSLEYYKQKDIDFFDIGFTFSYLNSIILYVHSLNSSEDIRQFTAKGNYIAKTRIPADFFNDINLEIGVSITKNFKEVVFAYKKFLHVKLVRPTTELDSFKQAAGCLPKFIGPVFPKWNWNILHFDM